MVALNSRLFLVGVFDLGVCVSVSSASVRVHLGKVHVSSSGKSSFLYIPDKDTGRIALIITSVILNPV